MTIDLPRRLALPALALLCLCAMAACKDPSGPPPPQGVASLEMVSGDGFAAPPGTLVPEEARVRALDAEGGPVAGVQVCFEAKNGATIVSGAEALTQSCRATDAQGIAAVQWRLGPAQGLQSLVASITGLPQITFTASATTPAPVQLYLATHSLTLTSLGDTAFVAVHATDARGFALRVPVTVTAHPHATVTATPDSVRVVAREYGGAWVYVAAQAAPQLRDSLFVMVEPRAATVVLSGRRDVAAGDTAWLRVGLADARGNPIPRPRPLTWTATGGATVRTEVVNGVQYGVLTVPAGGPVVVTATVDGAQGSFQLDPQTALAVGRFAIGYYQTCALDANGKMYCWGQSGLLSASGVASVPCLPGPEGNIPCWPWAVPVLPQQTFTRVSTFDQTLCMLDAEGRAWCMGVMETQPTPVPTALRFTELSTGRYHSCALTAAGEAYCWVGEGDGGVQPAPVGAERFVSITSGAPHSCGLTAQGTARCWDVGSSQLNRHLTPGGNAGGMRLRSISAGTEFTCAVDESGQGYCWGANGSFLGRGGGWDVPDAGGPVAGGARFRTVSAGMATVCALAEDGAAWCWGAMGKPYRNSSPNAFTVPTRIAGASFQSVHAGYGTACGVAVEGSAKCWLSDVLGNVGDGTASAQTFEETLVPRTVQRHP